MDAVFSRADLLFGIQTVQNVVSTRAALPVLSNILLEVEGTEARLSATDLEIGIRCKVPVLSSEEGGSVTIHAKRFSEIVRELPDSEIRITTDPSSTVAITCERSRFKILGLPPEDFPPFPEIEGGERVVIEQRSLKDMIKKTIFATSTEETRYALNGIFMEFKEGTLSMVATDTRRLALVKTPISSDMEPRSAIVPTKAFQELSRILEEGIVEIRLFGNQISFSTDSVTLVSRLIEGQFPKYELVIPKSYDRKARTRTEDLLKATRRVSLVSTEKASIVKIEFQPDRMILSASDPDIGEAVEEINASLEGDPLTMGYQARYITDVLRNIEQEEICFELTGALSPAVLKPVDDDSYLCLIMPVRT
jgi:DNA polymerase-3 subunit beta